MDPHARAWAGALALSAALCVAPLWSAELLPFHDAPEQIAVIATLRHWNDPVWSGPYVLDIGKSQYILYHLVGALLAFPLGSAELANRVLLSVVGFASPFALRALLRALDRDERLAVFAVPAFWSRPLAIGFFPYVACMPLVLVGLALAVREWREPRRRRAGLLALLAVLLFFLHVDPFVLFVLAAILMRVVLALGRGPSRREALAAARGLWWLVPALVLVAAWGALGSLRGSVDRGHVTFLDPPALAREFPAWSHDMWRSHVDEGCAVVVWTGFAVLLVQRGVDAEDRWKTALAAAPFAAAAACYFALPYAVGAAGMLNVRIATFGVLFAPLLVLRQEGWRGSAPIAAIFGASLVLAGNAAHEIRRVGEEELGDLGRLLDRMPPGAKVLTLPFEPTSRRMLWSPWSFVGAYHRARRGGVAGFSFSEIAHWPIHYKPGAGPPARPLFWTRNACRYRNEIDGAYYDFVLARGNVDPFRDAPPGPVFRRVDQERDFVLYARVAGETNPPWSFEDPGPCESRRSLEMRNARGL